MEDLIHAHKLTEPDSNGMRVAITRCTGALQGHMSVMGDRINCPECCQSLAEDRLIKLVTK